MLALWAISVATLALSYFPGAAVAHVVESAIQGRPIAHARELAWMFLGGVAGVWLGFRWFVAVQEPIHRASMLASEPWLALGAGVSLHVAGHLAAALLTHALEPQRAGRALGALAVAVAALVAFSLAFAAELRGKVPSVRNRRVRLTEIEPRPCLVVFLSALGPQWASSAGWPSWLPQAKGPRSLSADLQFLRENRGAGPLWSWEPLLAGIAFHAERGRLKCLAVVPSAESMPQLPWLLAILARYDALRNIEIRTVVGDRTTGEPVWEFASAVRADEHMAVEFEDFGRLWSFVRVACVKFERSGSFYDQDITIDFTGGKKPTSVVAAIATLNSSIQGQYVQTERPWSVVAYDLVADPDAPQG